MTHICSVPDCEKPLAAKGWCQAHYHRASRHDGDPLRGRTLDGEPLAYYLGHVDLVTSECITWPYGTSSTGYGKIRIDGRSRQVHVLACERHNGPPPRQSPWALHAPVICHTPLCFNAKAGHVAWGAPKDNNGLHRVLDGTDLTGQYHPSAKITWELASEIRIRYAIRDTTLHALAREYGVSHQTIWRVVTGHSWRANGAKL